MTAKSVALLLAIASMVTPSLAINHEKMSYASTRMPPAGIDALWFEGSKGKCKAYECNFYDYEFEGYDVEQPLKMNALAKNKATLFAVVPLWESQAQYFYELLEEIRKVFKQDTEASLLPIKVDPTEDIAIDPFHTRRVNILKTTSPNTIGGHPFLGFLQTLRHTSEFRDFNVFTDRPVLFMISPNETVVERLVVPTYEQIEATLKSFGVEKIASTDVHEM